MEVPLGDGSAGNDRQNDRCEKPKATIELPDTVAWFREAIGCLKVGERVLLSGSAGGGKSIMFTQLGIALARQGERAAFLLTEESEATHRGRIGTMLADQDAAEVARVQGNILVEDGLSTPELLPEVIASRILRPCGAFHGIRALFIDSLMGAGIPSHPGRRWDHIFNGLKLCQKAGVATFASAHINKGNNMAGPASLRHNCDCHLVMRQLGNHRLLYVTKNRNGLADQRQPVRLVIDPATLMLRPAPHAEPLAVCARSYLGGAGGIEIQSTISLTLGTRRRIVSGTVPHGEMQQLLDMITDVPGVEVNDTDFSVSTRIPGARLYAPTMALALSMTLIGSALQQPIPESFLFVGEIDLKRRVCDVPDLFATEIANAIIAGAIDQPVKIVCSPGTASVIAAAGGVPCAAARTLDEAVFIVWPKIR